MSNRYCLQASIISLEQLHKLISRFTTLAKQSHLFSFQSLLYSKSNTNHPSYSQFQIHYLTLAFSTLQLLPAGFACSIKLFFQYGNKMFSCFDHLLWTLKQANISFASAQTILHSQYPSAFVNLWTHPQKNNETTDIQKNFGALADSGFRTTTSPRSFPSYNYSTTALYRN